MMRHRERDNLLPLTAHPQLGSMGYVQQKTIQPSAEGLTKTLAEMAGRIRAKRFCLKHIVISLWPTNKTGTLTLT
jgi:hypothetical protein